MAELTQPGVGQLNSIPLLLTSKVCDTQFTQAISLIANYHPPNDANKNDNNNNNMNDNQQAQQLNLPATISGFTTTTTLTGDNQYQLTYDGQENYFLTIKQSTFSLPLVTQVIDCENPFPAVQQFLLYPSSLTVNQHPNQPLAPVTQQLIKKQTNSLPTGSPTNSKLSKRTSSLPDFSSLLNLTTEPEVKPNLIQSQSTKKCQQSAQNHHQRNNNQTILKSNETAQNRISHYHHSHQIEYHNPIEQHQLPVIINNQQLKQNQQKNHLDKPNVETSNQQQQQQTSTTKLLPTRLILNKTFPQRTISLPDFSSLMNMKTDESETHLNLTHHHHQHQHQQLNLNFNHNPTIQKHQQLCSDDKQSMMMTTDDMCTNNSMDKNKESLKVKLMLRRPIQQLIEQGIIPPPKQSPGIYEQSKKLERARTEDFLKHKIQRRPDRQVLIEQHILEDTTVSPTIHNKQRQLKKARLTDDLNDRLSHRPGPLELVKGNILLTDGKFAQAVKEGQIQFKATSEGEPIKHPPPRFIIEEETSSDDSVSPPLSTQSMVNNDSNKPQQLLIDTFNNSNDSGPLSIPMTTPLSSSSSSSTTNNNNNNTFERLATIPTSNNYFNQQQGINCITTTNNNTLNFGQGINLIQQSNNNNLDNQTLALGTFNCIPLATTTPPTTSPTLSTVFPTFTTVTTTNVISNNQPYQTENAAITFNSLTKSSSSAFSNTILSSSSPPLSSSSSSSTTPTTIKETGGPILTKNRKKSKSKSQPKTKTIKFHEYKGPPSAQKNQSSTNCNTESSYELLLKQQQLFLQWQLEWQNKYPPIILPSTAQKNNMDQVSISGNGTSASSSSSSCSTSNSYKNNGNSIVNSSVSTTNSTSNNNVNTLVGSSTSSNNIQENTNNNNNNNIVTFGNSNGFTANQSGNSNNNNTNPVNCGNNNANPITSIMITTSTRPTTGVEINGSHNNNNNNNSNNQIISNQHHQHVNSFVVCGINSGSKNNNNNNNNLNVNSFTDNGIGNHANNNNNTNGNCLTGTTKIILKLEDMKVSDLKSELKKRNLPVSGSKPQLIERLKPFLEPPMANNGFKSTNQTNDDNNNNNKNGYLDDPMSPNNNGMVIDEPDKFKVTVKSSPTVTPMELDPIVYTNIQVSDFQNKPTNRQSKQLQQQQQQQQQQQPQGNQPSFQLQFQNPSLFTNSNGSVTIPLALANQLQIVTTPSNPSTTSTTTTYNNREKLTYTTNNNQGNNLSAIISPGNASATVKANLAAFLHQHAQQQQKTLHLQLQPQSQQQQQQSNQLQGTIGSSSVCLTNQLPMGELSRSETQQQFSSTPLLLTSKVCEAQYNQQNDHHLDNSNKNGNSSNNQQIQQQQFESQPTTGITNFTGDNHFQVTSDGPNKYHLAIKQSTFSLPLLTQVIDSKNPFPTFHQFLLYPSSPSVNQQQNQQNQQQQSQQKQPVIPNLCRLKQTRTNSLPTDSPTNSISQRTSSLPDFSSLLNITTEPEVKPIQSQSTKKCQQSAQNHHQNQSHLLHSHQNMNQNQNQTPNHNQNNMNSNANANQNQNQSFLKSEETAQNHYHQFHNSIEQQLNINNLQQQQLVQKQKQQIDSPNLDTLSSQLLQQQEQQLSPRSNNSLNCELSLTESVSQRTISLPDFSSSSSPSSPSTITSSTSSSTATTTTTTTTLSSSTTTTTTGTSISTVTPQVTTISTSSFVSAYPTISSEEISFSSSSSTSKATPVIVDSSNDLDEKMDGIDLLFNDLLDFQGSPMNVDYGHWLTEIISDNNPFKLSSTSSSSTLPFTSNITATSMDHDPVLANNLAESCHYGDPLLDLYFDTENLTDQSLA